MGVGGVICQVCEADLVLIQRVDGFSPVIPLQYPGFCPAGMMVNTAASYAM